MIKRRTLRFVVVREPPSVWWGWTPAWTVMVARPLGGWPPRCARPSRATRVTAAASCSSRTRWPIPRSWPRIATASRDECGRSAPVVWPAWRASPTPRSIRCSRRGGDRGAGGALPRRARSHGARLGRAAPGARARVPLARHARRGPGHLHRRRGHRELRRAPCPRPSGGGVAHGAGAGAPVRRRLLRRRHASPAGHLPRRRGDDALDGRSQRGGGGARDAAGVLGPGAAACASAPAASPSSAGRGRRRP